MQLRKDEISMIVRLTRSRNACAGIERRDCGSRNNCAGSIGYGAVQGGVGLRCCMGGKAKAQCCKDGQYCIPKTEKSHHIPPKISLGPKALYENFTICVLCFGVQVWE
jgi:hypothetical protein